VKPVIQTKHPSGVEFNLPQGFLERTHACDAIESRVTAAMLAEAEREEEFIRKHSPIFFAQGYRIEELQLARRRTGIYPDRDTLGLMIRRPVPPITLGARKLWRRCFPYQPKGMA
jgi:hypothetical protein